MHTRLLGFALAGTVLCGGASIAAHHSYATTYRDEQRTIDGVVTTLVYRNPHSFLEVTAPDAYGRPRLWAVEWGSGPQLRRTLSQSALQPGDRVRVTGDIGRDEGVWRLRLRTIVRPRDGWHWNEVPPSQPGEGPRSGPGEGPRIKQ